MQIAERRSHTFTDLRSTQIKNWEFDYLAVTDVGRRRPINEDFFLLHPERDLYVVADGMGGHAAGEVASRIAAETVAAYFDTADVPLSFSASHKECETLKQHLVQAIKLANSSIFDEASDRVERRGMGTTIVALSFCDGNAYWAHVGDSRLYRLRDSQLSALTRDHSLLEQTLKTQQLSEKEARQFAENFPYKNVLSRALGSRYVVEVDVDSAGIEDGDVFVMTTDGVHDVIGDDAFRELFDQHARDLRRACEEVVAAANRAGGPDNITIACVQARKI